MKVVDYKILVAPTIGALERAVFKYIKEQWQPIGGYFDNGNTCSQTMIKLVNHDLVTIETK